MTHAHHWILGPHDLFPNQGPGMATCKLCGITRLMPDPFIDVPYEALMKRTFGRLHKERPAPVWTARRGMEV